MFSKDQRLHNLVKDNVDAQLETQKRAQYFRSDSIDFDIFNDEENLTVVDFPQPEDKKKDFSESSIIYSGKNTLRFVAEYNPRLESGEHLCARVSFSDSLDKIG
jgi:hypothetical protein